MKVAVKQQDSQQDAQQETLHEVYCYTGGKAFDATLPTIVFIHGAQNDHSVWALPARYFAHHGYNTLAVDLPGHGRSQGAPLATVEALSAWLIDLLATIGISKAILVGHSMGSLIALETAAHASANIAGLILIGTANPMKVSDALLEAANHDQARAISMVKKWSHFEPDARMLARSQGLMERIARLDQHNPAKSAQQPTAFHADLAACNNYQHGTLAAAAITCPTLFLLANQDLMTPPKAAADLCAAIPHAQVVQIDQSGHALMSQQPRQMLEHLCQFTSRLK
ncbi:alpha/beta fold hydrolase [Glaciimonas soli]|uniref:Alpha/beta fold hydrolase n=1 Tax=Glaciimonas soli TaxID=2590999 RepID=A0A843YUK7_9BURK|nr:alpha/beta hydrolase [Glaciimonas soli]MQR01677.1 alpha/beta fold hydrolase [Glaciimonas soli]